MTQSGTYREQAGKNSSEQSAGSRGGTATLNRAGARLPKRVTVEQLEPATVAQLLNAYRQQNLGTLLSNAGLTSNDGFSVVAPIKVNKPLST